MLRLNEPMVIGADNSDQPSVESMEQFVELLEQSTWRDIYVEEIEKWLTGAESLPLLRVFSQYIASSSVAQEVNALFDRDKFKKLSERCNDNVHLNYFRNLRINDTTVSHENQLVWLDQFAQDFRDLFVRHLVYVFSIRQEYMASSDYVDALDCGLEPAQDSQYWVAPFVQELFDVMVTPHRPDITQFIKDHSCMELH